ncbi:Non-specific serine/threonine protein kinase [Bertholletia excelsa]
MVFHRCEEINIEALSSRSREEDFNPCYNASALVPEGFTSPPAFSIPEPSRSEIEMVRSDSKPSSPPFYNAFEFISSMSSGFDLSSLFESTRRCGSMFTSKFPAPAIMAKLESAARKLNFIVVWSKEFKMKIEGAVEGRKGKLTVTAEVFEVAPEVAVVEFSKCAGDTIEYRKFCEEDVRPALKDIVWSWQGEEINCQQ